MVDSLTSLALQNAMAKIPPSPVSSELLGVIANMDLPELQVGKNLVVKIFNTGTELKAQIEVQTNTYAETIPIELKTNVNHLNINPRQEVEINAKVMTNNPDKVELQILSVKTPNAPEVAKALEVSEIAVNDKIIIKDIATYKQAIVFAPLKLEVSIAQKPMLVLEVVSLDTNVTKPIMQVDLKALPTIEAIQEKLQVMVSEKIVGEVVKIPVENAKDGFMLAVKTPLGIVLPEKPLNIEVGAKILLAIKEVVVPKIEAKEEIAFKNEPIKQIINILEPIKKEYPEIAAKIMARIPAQTAEMLPNLVAFVKASVSDDVNIWLGKNLTKEIETKPEILKETILKLNDVLRANISENTTWRVLEIPFFNGDIMSKISLAIKKMTEEETKNNQAQKAGTRFVLDTSFSRLGDFQFDGFALRNDKRFDLVLRTQKQMPIGFVENVINIFKRSLIEVDYVGNVSINQEVDFLKLFEPQPNVLAVDGIYI